MNRLLVVGPSVRWLMQSSLRAGFQPMGIDFFADVDATEVGEVVRVRQWAEVPAVAAALRPQAVLVGGGFETQVAMVEGLRQQVPVWNLGRDCCAALRDPAQWATAFASAGVRVPEHRGEGELNEALDLAKRWLVKQRYRAGGAGVRLLGTDEAGRWLTGAEASGSPEYLQEMLAGVPSSALFLLGPDRFVCLGFYRQLCGWREFGAAGYQYCGGIGPLPVTDRQVAQLNSLGRGLLTLGGRGVIGVDVLAVGDELCPIEVNPRITASGELWERAELGSSLVGLHAAEFAVGAGWPAGISSQAEHRNLPGCRLLANADRPRVHGKAILYWSDAGGLEIDARRSEWLVQGAVAGWLADIPQCGSRIERGEPVVTLLTSGDSESAVVEELVQLATELRLRLAS